MTSAADERRRECRSTPFLAGWRPDAIVRPGLPIRIINIDSHGVLVECRTLLRPGQEAELQLVPLTTGPRSTIRGRVGRCSVVTLEPLSFAAAIVFNGRLSSAAASRVGSTQPPMVAEVSGMDYPDGSRIELVETR